VTRKSKSRQAPRGGVTAIFPLSPRKREGRIGDWKEGFGKGKKKWKRSSTLKRGTESWFITGARKKRDGSGKVSKEALTEKKGNSHGKVTTRCETENREKGYQLAAG